MASSCSARRAKRPPRSMPMLISGTRSVVRCNCSSSASSAKTSSMRTAVCRAAICSATTAIVAAAFPYDAPEIVRAMRGLRGQPMENFGAEARAGTAGGGDAHAERPEGGGVERDLLRAVDAARDAGRGLIVRRTFDAGHLPRDADDVPSLEVSIGVSATSGVPICDGWRYVSCERSMRLSISSTTRAPMRA